MDSEGHVVADTVSMDSTDARLSTQRTIADGVGLVLAIRAAESTLEELNHEFHDSAPTHNIQYILQAAKIAQLKNALQEVVASLAALPHAPVDNKLDLRPLRAWIDANRERFDAFKMFCDAYRPASPMEEGEVHPAIACLSSAVKRIERRLDDLGPLVNPEEFELQQRAELAAAAHREETQYFWDVMGRFDFMKLGEEGRRLAVEQRVLRVARETLDGMVKMREGDVVERAAFSWLEPVEEDIDVDAMEIDF